MTQAVITDVTVRVFRTRTAVVLDSDGHGHPGPEHDTSAALLTITDSDGQEGYCLGPPEHLRAPQLDGYLRPALVGHSPLQRGRLWYQLAHRQRGSGGVLTNRTLAAVEQALWDLAGRRLGLPVWQLLGGVRDRVPAYGSTMCGDETPGGLSSPEDYAAFAEKLVGEGYRGIKLHTWMPPVSFAPDVARDIRACEAVREAVGPDVPLMLDGYHWYSRADTLTLGRALDRLGFTWFEEPMDEYSTSSYRWLAEQLTTPILGPESVEGSLYARAEWVSAQACDILRVGVPTSGGITPAMKTAALAEAFGMECELHGGGSGTLAVLGATANTRWYERGLLHPHFDYDRPPPHLTGIIDPMDGDGLIHLPTAAGLGDALNLDYIRAETVELR